MVVASILVRSSHQRCSVRKGALRNFPKFTEKHLCQRLFFNKAESLRSATLSKKRLWYRCFPVNFAKFLRTPLLRTPFWATASVCWDAVMNINTHIQWCEKNEVLVVDKLKSMYKKGKVHAEKYCLFKYYQLLCFQMFKCQQF